MAEFKPGDMVECVDGVAKFGWIGGDPLTTGARYTVLAVLRGRFRGLDGEVPALLLKEAKNGPYGTSYAAYRFRLIKPPATDISIFKEIVDREFHRETVKALERDMIAVAALDALVKVDENETACPLVTLRTANLWANLDTYERLFNCSR